MSREILFKARRLNADGTRGEWVEGSVHYSKDKKRAWICQVEPIRYVWVDPETVGQYVGIDDKNGVKIFESDKLWMGGPKPFTIVSCITEAHQQMQCAAAYYNGITVTGHNIHDDEESK